MSSNTSPGAPWGAAELPPQPPRPDAPDARRHGGLLRIALGVVLVVMAVIALLAPPDPDHDVRDVRLGAALFVVAGVGIALWGWRARHAASDERLAEGTPYGGYLRRGRRWSIIGVTLTVFSILAAIGAAGDALSFVVRGARARADIVSADCREVHTRTLCAMDLRVRYPDRAPAIVRMDEVNLGSVEWANAPTQIWVVYDSADPSKVVWRTQQATWVFVALIASVMAVVVAGAIWLASRAPRRRRRVRRWKQLVLDPAAPSRLIGAVTIARGTSRSGRPGVDVAMLAEGDGRWYRVRLLEPYPTGLRLDLVLRGDLRHGELVVPLDGETILWPISTVRDGDRPLQPGGLAPSPEA
jgi:hypothetical protein